MSDDNAACEPKSKNPFKRLACAIHAAVEPLCHLRETGFSFEEEMEAIDHWLKFREYITKPENKAIVFSEFCAKAPMTRPDFAGWIECAKPTGFPITIEMTILSRGQKTIFNKIGEGVFSVFSFGTDCKCCWGYRVLAIAAFWFSIGYLAH